MFKHILVPVDLTDVHQPALEIAARLAQGNDGEVTLLHVVEVIAEVWAAEDREFYTRREQRARDHLARLGHALEARGVRRREEVVFGHRAPEIVRYAGEVGADLIVLKSHRIDLEHPAAGWGTVSYKVGILTPREVSPARRRPRERVWRGRPALPRDTLGGRPRRSGGGASTWRRR